MKRLLFITQKIDQSDTVLGFVPHWLETFRSTFSEIHVICLEKHGEVTMGGVSIYSLGKERRANRISYLIRFYFLLFRLRGKYDAVFIHMNAEYALLGGPFWKLGRIPSALWYNHAHNRPLLRMVAPLMNHIFYTSSNAATATFPHAQRMPAGIDTRTFYDARTPRVDAALSLGRISPVKHNLEMVNIFALEHCTAVTLHIYGDALKSDRDYYLQVVRRMQEVGIDPTHMHSGVSYINVPQLLNTYSYFMNLTPTGSFDKTVLEAMLCGAITFFANDDFLLSAPEQYAPLLLLHENNPRQNATQLNAIHALPPQDKERIVQSQQQFAKQHSLQALVAQISKILNSSSN